jgi:hypothetical protein
MAASHKPSQAQSGGYQVNTDTHTIDISQLVRGNEIRVSVHRRYGEEAECADSWTAYVWDVMPEQDQIAIVNNDPATITDPTPTCRFISREGANDGGHDPSHTDTQKYAKTEDGCWHPITNEHPAVVAKQVEAIRERKIQKALRLTAKVRKVAYKDRDKLTAELTEVINELSFFRVGG